MKSEELICPQAVVGEKVRREKALDFSGCNSRPGNQRTRTTQPIFMSMGCHRQFWGQPADRLGAETDFLRCSFDFLGSKDTSFVQPAIYGL